MKQTVFVRYNSAPTPDELITPVSAPILGFETLDELKPWIEPGEKVFRLELTVEEVEDV